MNAIPLEAAVATVTAHLKHSQDLSAGQALALSSLMRIIPAGLRQLEQSGQPGSDPRFAAYLAAEAEAASHEVLRTQIYAAHLVERTAAHCLDVKELEQLREHGPDLSTEPDYANGRPSYKGAAEFLAAWLGLDYFDSKRRVDDAHHVISQIDPSGTKQGPQFPKLAGRFNDPDDCPRTILAAARRLRKLEPTCDEFTALPSSTALTADGQLVEDVADQILTEPDPRTRAKALNQLFKQVTATVQEQDPISATGLFRQGTKNGLVNYGLRLLPYDAATIESLIVQADNPRTEAGTASRVLVQRSPDGSNASAHPDFVTAEEAASSTEIDSPPVNVAQRRLQALLNFLRIDIAKLSKTPKGDGMAPEKVPVVRPTVMVHLELKELLGLAKTSGITSNGMELSPTDLRRALAEANIIPMVLGGRGEVLDVGRSQRNFPGYMRRAIKARDRGCIVPGCTVAAEHCEIHHIIFWKDGGVTAVWCSATLCTSHHHDAHAGVITIRADGGVPTVLLPKYQDPEQLPRRNRINFRSA